MSDQVTFHVSVPRWLAETLQLSDTRIRELLALMLYRSGEVSLGLAVELARVDRYQFLESMQKYGIHLNYSEEDLAKDLRTMHKLGL